MILQNRVFIDIETKGRNPAAITKFEPQFEAPGNYKDSAKIAEYIKEKRKEWYDKTALSALTGEVLAIGIKYKGNYHMFHGYDEKAILTEFVEFVKNDLAPSSVMTLVGLCCDSFDFPFLTRRGWAHGINLKKTLSSFNARKDLAVTWSCGNYNDRYIALDTLAEFFGVGSKNGDGKDFAQTYATNKEQALAYLSNELDLTEGIAEAMLLDDE